MEIKTFLSFAVFFSYFIEVNSFISQFRQHSPRLQHSTHHQSSRYKQEATVDLKEFEIFKTNHPLSPPSDLLDLEIGEKVNPYKNMTIIKLASNPHIYLVKNFIEPSQREKLIEEATDKGMEYSGTKAGDIVKQRVNSYTTWVKPHSIVSADDNEDETSTEKVMHGARKIATVMTKISSLIFLPDFFREHLAGGEKLFHEENLQIVKYDVDGKFDVHHDGLSRFLTVLTYLNGVAGTWFPYAIVEGAADNDDEDEPPNMHAGNVASEKEIGKDGIVIVGNDDDRFEESRHVVKVEAGDAIAFYNYDWLVNFNDDPDIPSTGPIMNWRSIHSGLKTTKKEKWIATNWFQFNE